MPVYLILIKMAIKTFAEISARTLFCFWS